MRQQIRTSLLVALALAMAVAWAPLTAAQGVTTGALSGVVVDQDGGRLPGVTVEAVNPATGTRYVNVTDEQGRYSLRNMRTGDYNVTASLEGFVPAEQSGIEVRLGQDDRVNFTLEIGAIEDVVTVTGEANPLISSTRTGSSSNVSTREIEALPTLNRGFEDFARTNPFITVSTQNEDPDAISVAGRNSRYNNIQIDGAVNNDLFGLADQGTPGGQADTTPISLDAIAELQLLVVPFDVRQGGFTGGGINAITRSGTNDLKGSVFFFTRDDSLVGDGPDFLGEFGTFEEEQYGFRVGGPISQDKLFFFVNGEFSEKTEPTGWSIDGSGGQVFGDGELVDEAERFRNILIDNYGFDPGGIGQQTLETPSDKFFGRLDYNLGVGSTLTLRHNYVDATNDVNRPDDETFEFPSETYVFNNETNSTVLQWNTVFGGDKFNEFRGTYQTIEDRRAGVVDFPWIEVEQVIPGTDFEFEAGTEPFSTANALDQDVFELTNDFTWILGDHTLTIGTHNEFFSFKNLFLQNFYGSYEFETLDDLEANSAREFEFTIVPPGQDKAQEFDVDQLGLYVGDQWAARPNLTLMYGLRWDSPQFPDEPSRNPFTEEAYGLRTDSIPDGNDMWSPRLGFNWDITGDATQQLRGGLGLFAGRTPYVWISNNYARTGIEQQFVTVNGDIPLNPDPFNQSIPGDGEVEIGEFNLIDPDFEFPQVWRYNLAYDRQLGIWGLLGSVELMYSESEEEILYKNVNIEETGQTLPFDGRPLFDEVRGDVDGAYLITNTDKGESTNVVAKVEKPYDNGFSGYVSYAYSDSEVVNEGTSSRAVSNWVFNEAINPNNPDSSVSDFNVEHRFTAQMSYRLNRQSSWPTTVALFYNHQSGRPYSTILASDFVLDYDGDGDLDFGRSINGDGSTGNDLFYVPSGPNDVVLTSGTWEQLDAFISSDECLDENRGSIAPRNCSRAPWSHTLDLRIAQAIPVFGTNVDLTLDVVNLVNLFDEDSGVVRYAGFNAVTAARYQGVTDDGKPIYQLFRAVTDPEGTGRFTTSSLRSRWRAKLGVRVTF